MMGSSKSLSGSAVLLLACLLSVLLVSVTADFRSTLPRLTKDDLFGNVESSELEFEDPTDVRELLQSLPTALTHPDELMNAQSQVGAVEDGFAFLQSLPSTDSATTQAADFAAAGAEADAQFELAGEDDAVDDEADADAFLLAAQHFGSLNLSPEVALSFSMSGGSSASFSFSADFSTSTSEQMSFSFSDFSFSGFSFEFSASFSGSSSGDFSFSGSSDSGSNSGGFSDFSAGNSDFSMSGDFSDFSGDLSGLGSGSSSGIGSGSGDGHHPSDRCTPGKCLNDGDCHDGPSGFYCECQSHYNGPRCENHTPSTVATMDRPVITHVSSDHVYISWTAPAYPPVAELTEFTVKVYERVNGTRVFWVENRVLVSLRATRIFGLEVGRTFEFTMFAHSASDFGENSPFAVATTAYAAPWGLAALTLRDLRVDSMTAAWAYPADLNAYTEQQTLFVLELSHAAADGSANVTTLSDIAGTEYTFGGLMGGINYTVTYYAQNPAGISERWAGLEWAVLPTTPPPPPTSTGGAAASSTGGRAPSSSASTSPSSTGKSRTGTTGSSGPGGKATSTGTAGPTFVEARFFITGTLASLPANFDEVFCLELATAAMPAGGNLAEFAARFQVADKQEVTTAAAALRLLATRIRVTVRVLSSADGSGVSAAALFSNLAAAIAKGGVGGTFLSTASGLEQLCDDGTYATICRTAGSSGAFVGVAEPEPESEGSSMGGIIGGVVGGVVALILVSAGIYRYRKNRPPKVHDSSGAHTQLTNDPSAA